MELRVHQGNIQQAVADTIIVNLFEGVTEPGGATGAVDQALDGAIREMIADGDLHGKIGEVGVVYPRGAIPARRVLVVGLGKAEELDLEKIRQAAGTAIRKARELNARDVASVVHGAGAGGLNPADAAQASAEGILLGYYRFNAPRRTQEPVRTVETLSFIEFDAEKIPHVEAGVKVAEALAAGVYLARDLVNLPPNVATPTRMASAAREIAELHGITLVVGDREWAAQHKMGAYLAVAKGAGEPPMFIVLEYNRERMDLDTVVLVGKGITFDTGGISIKPSDKMDEMKSDMAGAAAVLGAMKAIALLKLPVRVVGLAPCTENMPDAYAYHPADIITASNGKTIEIISTDAEGRMVLSDALVYAQHYKPKAVIDLATLTGACVVALGEAVSAGLFCSADWLRDKLLASAAATHERLWPMPLWDDYKKKIKSEVADMKNSGGRYGGVGASAIFLKEFTDYPWAHLDIAGMALIEKRDESPYIPAGGSGYGVRLLVDLLRNWYNE